MLPRKYVKCPDLDEKLEENGKKSLTNKIYPGKYQDNPVEEAPKDQCNLISSELEYLRGELHAPTLDIDYPIACYESSTPGHYHLLIDIPIPWRKYKKLLKQLYKCGVIEKGFYITSVQRKATMLRRKGVLKPGAQVKTANMEMDATAAWKTWQ